MSAHSSPQLPADAQQTLSNRPKLPAAAQFARTHKHTHTQTHRMNPLRVRVLILVRVLVQVLVDMGCYEVSLGDTIGVGTPGSVVVTRDQA